jgi:CRP-like cAMP-binding protein
LSPLIGEIALFEGTRRTASVRAAKVTELCVLHKSDFDVLMATHADVASMIRKTIEERKEADRRRKEEEERKKKEEEDRKKHEEEEERERKKIEALQYLMTNHRRSSVK